MQFLFENYHFLIKHADFVINYSKEDFAKKVMELTEGKGLSVVYDGVGKSTFEM